MWKVLVWLSVLAAAEAFKEPYIEYLYSRKDGQVLIEPISSSGHRSYARNKTIYITNTNPDLLQNESMQYLRQLSQTREPRFLRWTSAGSAQLRPVHDQFGRFRGQEKLQGMKKLQAQQRLQGLLKLNGQKKPSYSKLQFKNKITNTVELSSNKMKLSGKNAKTDPQLELLKQLLKPEEVKTCTEGASIFRGCNHCLCIGGQLYVCTARVYKPGDMNFIDLKIAFEMDTNCIEGERIHSFDVCNRCYCGGGHILCTKKKCRGDGDGKRPQECTPGTEIPSPDSCNICACNTKGFVVCTTKTCGPEISPGVKDMGCKPDTWYSLERHSRCKECYCLNGKKAFCYVNLCKSRAKMALSYKSKTPQLDLPGALPDHCDVDDYMQDRCTKCFCTHVGIWYCKTREIGKCDPKLNPFAISNHDNNGKETTTTQLPATDDSEHTNSKKRRKRKKTTTTTQLPTTTTTDPTTSKTKRRRKKTTTTTQLPHEYYDYSDEYYDYSDELNVTKGPFDAFPDDYDSHETISSDIDSGPFCTKGQYFTQGSDTHCQGCFCTINNEWKCYSIKGSCRDKSKTPQLDLPGALPDHCDVDDYMQDRCTKCFCTHVGIWYCKTREIGKCDPKLNPFAISNHDNNGKETTTTQLPATDDSEHTNSKKRRKRKKTTTTTQLPTTTTTDPTTSKTKRRRKKTTTTTQLPHEYYDYSDEYYDYSDELNVTKGPFDAFPDDYDSHETISSDIDSGPFCTKGQYFTQGSDTHCQGCFCTINNEWKCYSIKGSCREFPKTKSCNTGKLRKSVNPCSICYCGNDHKSYCATDETCSYSIKPNSCEPISCMNHCMGEGTSFGVCHNDGCICVN